MNSLQTNSAISIVDALMKHPITTSMRSIPKNSENATIDLELIKTNVKNNKYADFYAFCNDLEKVWAELELRNDNSTVSKKITHECRRLLGKLRTKYACTDIPQWCNSVYKTRTQLTYVMNTPPEEVTKVVPSLGKARPTVQSKSGMSERETYNFLQAAEQIKSDEDMREMIKIVNELQPELDSSTQDVNINVNELNPQTAEALKNYLRTALEKQGSHYPE